MSDPTQRLDVREEIDDLEGFLRGLLIGQDRLRDAMVERVAEFRAALSTTPAPLCLLDCDCHSDPELDHGSCDHCTGKSEAERAIATPAPLDAAWAAAEAALPEGWHIASMASDGPENPGWYVDARSAMVGGQRIAASGPTAAAALLALAEKLREYAKP